VRDRQAGDEPAPGGVGRQPDTGDGVAGRCAGVDGVQVAADEHQAVAHHALTGQVDAADGAVARRNTVLSAGTGRRPAPVMMRQIKGRHGCEANAWPDERKGTYISGPPVA
jgi:hypothetical protein